MKTYHALRRVVTVGGAVALVCALTTPPALASRSAHHTLEFRPVLAALPRGPSRAATAAEATAIASCDVRQLQALAAVPVSATPLPRDACGVLPFAPHGGNGALYVGPARITGADVRSAGRDHAPGLGWVVDLRLKKSGMATFNRMATDLFGKDSPGDQVALVVDGKVVSNPAFQSSSFSGPIEISGSFTGKDAAALAKAINQARR
jgi:preprotein translocase subunit SecD